MLLNISLTIEWISFLNFLVSFSSNDEHIEQVFRRLEEVQGQDKQNRIDEISKKLKSLEEELDILVLCSEMHK
jgi:hypothetical protein